MQELIIKTMGDFGYIGVFLLILVENIFPPIPSEIILTFGGFMTTYTRLTVWGVILAATAASVLGAVILYIIGRLLNADRLERIVTSRLGRMLHLKSGDIKKAEQWFIKRGGRAVFFGRFIPIVRSLISLPAGMSKMRFDMFIALTTAGTLGWNVALVSLGRIAGNTWEKIAHYFDVYSLIAAVVLVAVAVVLVAVFVKKRFLNR